jgi:hypothetical protein
MSEEPHDRMTARLERLAEMDLAAAEHVHAQLLATTEPKALAEASRAYQRASRTLRQTLMLQMKHDREQAAAEARAARTAERPFSDADRAYSRLVNGRIEDVQDAVGRVAAAAHPDRPRLQREALDRLDMDLDDWSEDDDFINRPLDELIVEACERVGLPVALARQWEDLPKPAQTFDPAAAPPPAIPDADTG